MILLLLLRTVKAFSKRSIYGIRAMSRMAISHQNDRVYASLLAQEEHIPHKFLEAILLDLIRAGLLDSRKGVHGGYRLSRVPSEISVGEIIRALDGPLVPMVCARKGSIDRCEECVGDAECGARLVLQQLRFQVDNFVDRTSLADIARQLSEPVLQEDFSI